VSVTAWLSVAVFVGAYAVIVTEKLNRTAVALTGAAAMVAIGSVRGEQIFFSEDTGIDWNVIFLLFG
jgi:Na+/H+ antiporter NhaD/arsenite permease-like protein